MQLTAPAHRTRVGRIGILDFQRDVALELLVETIANLSRRDVLAFLSSERRIVDEEVDADGRLLDGDTFETLGMLEVRDRQADLYPLEARERDDFTGRCTL